MIEEKLVERLYRQAKADRWRAPMDRFAQALEASAARAFAGRRPDPRELERYLTSLHLEDLALACACAAGDEEAWEHFVLEQRPLLYRAATRSIRAAEPAISPIPCTRISSGCESAPASGSRCSATSTDAAA